jgi:Acyl-CoA dehydrogenase, N-terminal domain/Acyl-CoA dehydrogenase, middle domain
MDIEKLRSFAGDRIRGSFQDRSRSGEFDFDLWMDLARLGINRLTLEEDYGGEAGSIAEFVQAAEVLASEGLDLGLTLSVIDHVMLCAYPIQIFGSGALKQQYLPALAAGELIGAAGISEPGTGADPVAMKTGARREDGGYVLNGVKQPITNGPVADLFLVIAVTNPEAGKQGLSAFLVPVGEGVSVEPVNLEFLPTSPHGCLILEDVWVPEENLLAKEGGGHTNVSRPLFLWERAVLMPAIVAYLEKWHHMVISAIAPDDTPPDALSAFAQHKVDLTAYRILARQLLEMTFALPQEGRDRMELLLFFGKSLPAWVQSMQQAIENAMLPLDDLVREMLRDLRLLEVGSNLLDWQFQKLLF